MGNVTKHELKYAMNLCVYLYVYMYIYVYIDVCIYIYYEYMCICNYRGNVYVEFTIYTKN